MKILSGHVSPETAYLVNDYPYGFTLRCKMRYWLESDKRRGTRLVSQTSNPKAAGFDGDVWNKPKAGTYARFAGCMYLDEQDHVCWSGLTEYATAAEAEKWLETYKDGLCKLDYDRARVWVIVKKAYEEARDAKKKEVASV